MLVADDLWRTLRAFVQLAQTATAQEVEQGGLRALAEQVQERLDGGRDCSREQLPVMKHNYQLPA